MLITRIDLGGDSDVRTTFNAKVKAVIVVGVVMMELMLYKWIKTMYSREFIGTAVESED